MELGGQVMGEKHREKLDKEWRQLCHELEAARKDYEAAEALIPALGDGAPRTGDEASDTNDALRKSIEANLRRVETLREMRVFIAKLDD